MTKQRYIFFSIVTNILLTKIVLSASKHLVTASGMGWFPYEGNLHLVLPLLMPLLSLFGAVMTIQKRRKTGFDILINVLTPWLLLLFLYVWKSSLKAGICLLIGVVVCVVFVLLEGNRRLVHLPLSHRRKRLYYTSRSVLMIFLMLTLIPAGVYSKYRQQAEQMHLQQFVEEFDVEISMNDIRKDIFCASGPGGQSVNTTYSAIRLTHIPTGIVVQCQDQKSQLKNFDKAFEELRTRVFNLEYSKYLDEIASKRKTMVSTGDRSAKIRTYNYPQGRITDHRINYTIYNLSAFMDGDIQDCIDHLIVAENAERLKESEL